MAVVLPFSARVAQTLSAVPAAGETHRWLAKAASGLRSSGRVGRGQCGAFLRRCCDLWVSHRVIPDREIEAALRLAYDSAPPSGGPRPGGLPEWPAFDPAARDALCRRSAPVCDGSADTGATAEEAVSVLFGPDDLVCAGWVCERAVVRPLRELRPRLWTLQFVVPNPMKGAAGLTKEGKPSARCQGNVAERRYVVAEFDDPGFPKADQARVASGLGEALPLVMIVDSGGKSLHCWYDCRGADANALTAFFSAAVRAGADPTRWDPCGWVRMPGGIRVKPDGQRARQKVLWLKAV